MTKKIDELIERALVPALAHGGKTPVDRHGARAYPGVGGMDDDPMYEAESIKSAEVIHIPNDKGAMATRQVDKTGDTRENDRVVRMTAVEQAIKDNSELLKSRGMVITGKLGAGQMGIAFNLQDGKVLKVTADKREALASFKIEGKPLKHVNRIYRVFRLPGDNAVFGIVQDKLTPLTTAEKVVFDKNMGICIRVLNRKWSELHKGWDHFARAVIEAGETYDRPTDYLKKALTALSREFGVHFMMEELFASGIGFHDYHGGNLMKNSSGKYVINDLGVSEVVGGVPPPMLEDRSETGDAVSDAEDILLASKDLLIKNNIRPIGDIGKGSRGVAFETQDGKVLKVTIDKDEALASFRIQGKRIPHVIEVYRVFSFPEDKENFPPTWGILQERLESLTSKDKAVLHWANKRIEALFDNNMLCYTDGWKNFMSDVHQAVDEKDIAEDSKDWAEIVKALKVYKRFGLNSMMDGLSGAGIKFYDYHVGNIMKRAGKDEFVITDLGASEVPGGLPPPTLESVIKENLADRLAVIFAPLQPFSKPQAELVRRLGKGAKVILLLQRGPIDFETMHDVIKSSLPDMEGKVEVYDAFGQDLAQALDRAEQVGSQGLRPGAAIELYAVGDKQQLQQTMASSGLFGESPAIIRPLDPKLTIDKASIAAVRNGSIKNVMDPHVFSDHTRARDVEMKLKAALQVKEMVEGVLGSLTEKALVDWNGELNAEKVIQHNLEKLKPHITFKADGTLEFLGSGRYSMVYEAGANKVLKITADVKDATAAYKLKGKSLPHVIKIHDAFMLESPPELKAHEVFAVIAEKIEALDENGEESAEITRAFMLVRETNKSEELFTLLSSNKLEEFFNTFRQSVREDKMEEIQGSPQTNKYKNMISKINTDVEAYARELWDVMRKYSIDKMIDELSRAGVAFADYKGDNLGKKGNQYILLDIGTNSEAGQKPPPLGESLMETAWPEADILRAHDKARPVEPPTRSIPVGMELYHGSTQEHIEPRKFLSLTTNTKAAKQWVEMEHGEKPHILKFRITHELRVLEWPATHDHKALETAAFWMLQLTGFRGEYGLGWNMLGSARVPELWETVEKMGFDGIWLESIDSGHDELMVFDPASKIAIVKPEATVSQEGFQGGGLASGGNLMKRSQSSPWSTGKGAEGLPPGTRPDDDMTIDQAGSSDPDSDLDKLATQKVDTMVKRVIGGLAGK